ncbi:hypothetical protein HBN50_00465 [Halobacteriovorax sp. GB3]|uniref:hypothetical protein n=1 Tax=Halobacteriovorax sp. GB3 TaxID=2719615 RepID=UPI0023618E8B|nr:hypothetical protein [Halobacteriovorax sp. GB3]MDD0851538.1 hypothetical protein [Halobacteriovorax sp. GB3]
MGSKLFYRFQQVLIFVIHIVLLYWMYYTLANAGTMTTIAVLLHFTGLSLYGALLIRGTAYWAKYHHEKGLKKKQQ